MYAEWTVNFGGDSRSRLIREIVSSNTGSQGRAGWIALSVAEVRRSGLRYGLASVSGYAWTIMSSDLLVFPTMSAGIVPAYPRGEPTCSSDVVFCTRDTCRRRDVPSEVCRMGPAIRNL